MKLHALVAAVMLTTVCSTHAEMWEISGTMSGQEEVPPNTSGAFGSVAGTYDDTNHIFTWLVQFSGLEGGTVTGAHFHEAAVGSNGPVQIGFTDQILGQVSGSANGASVLSGDQEFALLNNLFYANIHSQEAPGGEIRGQLAAQLVPVPSVGAIVVVGMFGLISRRRTM